MFMFDQVRVCPSTACDVYVISVHPFTFDCVVEKQTPKAYMMIKIMVCRYAQYRISWIVDLHLHSLDFNAVFKSNDPNTKKLRISIGIKSNNVSFFIAHLFASRPSYGIVAAVRFIKITARPSDFILGCLSP